MNIGLWAIGYRTVEDTAPKCSTYYNRTHTHVQHRYLTLGIVYQILTHFKLTLNKFYFSNVLLNNFLTLYSKIVFFIHNFHQNVW
jgi:hypothetical protein